MMWASVRRNLVSSTTSLTLLSQRGSSALCSTGCHDCLGSPVILKLVSDFNSNATYSGVWRRNFSSYSGNNEVETVRQSTERRVPMPRAMWKGPFVDAFLMRMKKRKESINNKKIWSRRSVILPEFVNSHVRIYTGKIFIRRKITEGMVGRKFGEFAPTRSRRQLRVTSANAKKASDKKKKGK